MLNVFYMFDTENDLFRARKLNPANDGSAVAAPTDLDYDTMTNHGDDEVRVWIDEQLALASCLVILIGQHTAGQRWVQYAIGVARNLDKPMIGVTIDKLTDAEGRQSVAGANPFASAGMSPRALSAVEIYEPQFATSAFARAYIRYALPHWVELAVREDRSRRDIRSRRQERTPDYERQQDAS